MRAPLFFSAEKASLVFFIGQIVCNSVAFVKHIRVDYSWTALALQKALEYTDTKGLLVKIKSITAREIIASGGYPSIETCVTLESGNFGVASVPYGASAGTHEATVLTDNDPSRYSGQGMLKAVELTESEIASRIIGMSADDQRAVDVALIDLDGTAQKTRLGGNTILAASLACARAAANEIGQPLYRRFAEHFNIQSDFQSLPQPMAVVIEGGKHAHNSTDLQEYCFSVLRQTSRHESIRIMLECYHALSAVLKKEGLSTNVGNEGAFAPNGISSNEAPFEYMVRAIQDAGYEPGGDVGFSVDAAASEFFEYGRYIFRLENRSLGAGEVQEYFAGWMEKYPIVSFEDPLAEDAWGDWANFKQVCDKHGVELIGDDLTVTNTQRLQKAIDTKAISSILIKFNQAGTVTETVDSCMLAKQSGFSVVPSHRGGGETNDTAMVDLAVAVGAKFIKVGPTRGERVVKYNRLMEIERELK